MQTPLNVLSADVVNAIEDFEAAQRAYNPYCPHGRYVGGCGIDWMCHDCEMGYCFVCGHERCPGGLVCIDNVRQNMVWRLQTLSEDRAILEDLEYSLYAAAKNEEHERSIREYLYDQLRFRRVIDEDSRRDRLGLPNIPEAFGLLREVA